MFVLLFPLRLLLMAAEKVKKEADRDLFDVGVIQRKLLSLEVLHEKGELSKEEFEQHYSKWLSRYEKAREREREALKNWTECTSDSDNAIE
ncbi:gas vesicle protein GvpG [Metabacillus indicus]|uniref:gas vesicle protein GvpG n=1 Tax=Metabacillus indicus TaxID=246786 RepID=UPI002A026419|nr:gas vesicle protein GvpG [Metabacillus indicus]MDX8292130.1 gas vesicle protein GvpG [Metabacillus indicus]